jgi:hypothetical protein
LLASQRQTLPSETMKLPWLFISGGIAKFGSRSAAPAESQ